MKHTRKLLTTLLALAIVLGLIGSAYAVQTAVTATKDTEMKVLLNGNVLDMKDVNGKTVDPIFIDGTTYLPVRAIGEALGLTVGWNGDTRQVTLNGGASQAAASPALRLQFDGKTYNDVSVKNVAVKSDGSNYKEVLEAEIYNFKVIRNLPTLYDRAVWEEYLSRAGLLNTVDAAKIGKVQQVIIDNAVTARKALVQKAPASEAMWYIWDGDNIPMKEDKVTFTAKHYDNEDFKPFLVPYILKDQSKVKANLIIVAGGGYSERNNSGEGYPIAAEFNKLGYNCFVLQRRVDPYCPEDIWMDLQRSIRYLRYNAKSLKLEGMDCMVAVGFSGGSMTIHGQIDNCYGNVQPTIYDKDYKPDAVDKMNSDLDVALLMYGPGEGLDLSQEYKGLVTENKNIPDAFIAGGEEDPLINPNRLWTLAESIRAKGAKAEVQTYATVGHGFGTGAQNTNSMTWIAAADQFVKTVKGIGGGFGGPGGPALSIDSAVIPAKYTKYTQIVWSFAFGNTDMIIAANEDLSELYVTFVAFNGMQIVEIVVDESGAPMCTFDASGGFMAGDVPAFYEKAQGVTDWMVTANRK